MIKEKDLLRWHDNDYCLKSVNSIGCNLKYVKNQTEEMCLAAIKQNSEALQYVHTKTEKICLEALNQDIDSIIFVNIKKFPLVYEKYQFMLL